MDQRVNFSHDLVMREADINDVWFIYELRNQDKTRRYSRSSAIIDKLDHQQWFEKRLSSVDSTIFVFAIDSNLIGMTRLDQKSLGVFEISVIVSNSFQGFGLGKRMVKETIDVFLQAPIPTRILADVHIHNTASNKLFTALGFVLIEPVGNFNSYERSVC